MNMSHGPNQARIENVPTVLFNFLAKKKYSGNTQSHGEKFTSPAKNLVFLNK
jgi:hypothetical protein